MLSKIVFCLILAYVWLLTVADSQGKNISEESCNGSFNCFLCNCTAFNSSIDILFPTGWHYFYNQSLCLLEDKSSINLIGNSPNDTIIECKEPFNIVFKRVRNLIISNITIVNCGNVLNDIQLINKTIYHQSNKHAHFGSNFRFAIMLYQVKDLTITNLIMTNTRGYAIVAINAIGNVTISKFYVQNTTFPNCKGYDYDSDTADFNCSGSGLFMIYHNKVESYSLKEANTTLLINDSDFTGNRNYLPNKQFTILVDAINTGFFQTSIPLQGAAGITIFYFNDWYDVNATIINSRFYNNNGNISANIAIVSLSTTKGKTLIQHGLFSDCNRMHGNSFTSSEDKNFTTGGISYYYLSLLNKSNMNNCPTTASEILTVINCSFTKLRGALGAAFHIKKISVDATSLLIRIERCNFTENLSNVGSAVYAVDHRFNDNLANNLTIYLVTVNAESNTLSPDCSVESSSDITGVFHSDNCHFKFHCAGQCNFTSNQPSVFYGRSASLTISGNATFFNNTSQYGGVLHLLDTVFFVYLDSKLIFSKNRATGNGGAISIFFFNTDMQTQDICPIQFLGYDNATSILTFKGINDIFKVPLITFNNNVNTAGGPNSINAIYANVYYVCTWYSYTLTQIYLGKKAEIINGKRKAVYNETFIPPNTQHLSILGYLPCPCDENNNFNTSIADHCLRADLINNTMDLKTSVIIGRSFTISLVILDVVGSVGYSDYLYSQVLTTSLMLRREQLKRPFSTVNGTCTPIDFTIYSSEANPPNLGVLQLSLPRSTGHNFRFKIDKCPTGFSIENTSTNQQIKQYACTCGKFFNKSPIREDFQCNTTSGKIKRIDAQSWLSRTNYTDSNNDTVDNDTATVEYIRFCLHKCCDNTVSEFNLSDSNVLCTQNHAGRACGACIDGYSKTFGSNLCDKECSNFHLFTILLYGALGIVLVCIIYLLKLTVTMGTIHGLIFFCNVMSINENLFFDLSKFSFTRVFVSLVNLDLGFKMCFYQEMTEIAKTGLQFVFPIYLWLLMFIIIMVGKRYIRIRKSIHSAVPVLATLIMLSYSKLLRATFSVFSLVIIYYSTKENNFSKLQKFIAWKPDPNVKYLEGIHIPLFLIALVFTVLFIFPLAFALTFPKIILRSKKLSYFCPLLDCIYAPYKDHCRFWFGMRIIVLICISGLESYLFSNQLLLSGVIVILFFALMQAYIHPFKSTINNTLDLMFMGLFITLSVVVLYLYPNTSDTKQSIAVNILGSLAFLLFCFIMIFHIHDTVKHFKFYSKFIETLKIKFYVEKLKGNWNPLLSVDPKYLSHNSDQSIHQTSEHSSNYAYLRESLLEEQFN